MNKEIKREIRGEKRGEQSEVLLCCQVSEEGEEKGRRTRGQGEGKAQVTRRLLQVRGHTKR